MSADERRLIQPETAAPLQWASLKDQHFRVSRLKRIEADLITDLSIAGPSGFHQALHF